MKKYIPFLLLILTLTWLNYHEASAQQISPQKYKGIAIYIDYPDVPAELTPVRLDSLLNGLNYQEEGAERSWRKYWLHQSRGKVDFSHDIFFFTAPQPSTYYESITWQEGILLWKDALEYIISQFPDYDWRGLSIIDDSFAGSLKGGLASVMIISSKWGPNGVGAAHGPRWTLSNGIKVNNIHGATIRAPWDTTPVNMFMTLHEGGHAIFGFPDTYDTDGGDEHSGGTGVYSLMSGGKPDVEPIGGPFLAQYQWCTVVEPTPGSTTITLAADGDSVVVVRNPYDPNEFFTIEARKKEHIGNSLFPTNLGLLIWHSDNKVATSNRLSDRTKLKHYRHSIEQADGRFELEQTGNQRGNRGDIFEPGDQFTDKTTPDTKWWDAKSSGLEITDIQFPDHDHVKFSIFLPEPEIRYDEIQKENWTVVSATPWQSGYGPEKAFDGDSLTYYHIPWGNSYDRPHEVVFDLGDYYVINEFYYTANTNTTPPWEGRIADYNIFFSDDGENWGELTSGTFFFTGLKQYTAFPDQKGRYLKLQAIDSWIGNGTRNDVRTSIAEIELRGTNDFSFVERIEQDLAVSIFPNPVTDILRVQTSLTTHLSVEIFDLFGRLVRSDDLVGSANLDVTEIETGFYIMLIEGESGVKVLRFTKR